MEFFLVLNRIKYIIKENKEIKLKKYIKSQPNF